MEQALTALHWAQGFPIWLKLILSGVFVIVAFFLVAVLWQPPPPSEVEAKKSKAVTVTADHSSTAASQLGNGNNQVVQAGDHNTQVNGKGALSAPNNSGQQFNAPLVGKGGHAENIGPFYYGSAPPVTEQERQKAVQALVAQLGELNRYPGLAKVPEGQTQFEKMALDKTAQFLYAILSSAYVGSIEAIPKHGKQLLSFKDDYHRFHSDDAKWEGNLMKEIIPRSATRLSGGHELYFRYIVYKLYGVDTSDFYWNYGVNAENAETLYKAIGPSELIETANVQMNTYVTLTSAAHNLIGAY